MKIVIIGGGIAGISCALDLADQGHKVTLLEARSELLEGSSNNTPCRVGVGLHYIDIPTAKKYLHSTIEFLKKYKDFILETPPELSGSDYVVVKDSEFDYAQISKLHAALIEEYQTLIDEDPANKVLGEANKLITFAKEGGSRHLKQERVSAIYSTAEQILDWPKLRQYLIKQAETHSNITIFKNCLVAKMEHTASDVKKKFQLTLKGGETIYTDSIINCAWEQTEALDSGLGVTYVPNSRTVRGKAMAMVRLPEELKDIRTLFVCFGPHCAVTHLGNRIAYITYEPVTNFAQSTALTINNTMQFWLQYGSALAMNEDEVVEDFKPWVQKKRQIGQAIIDGVAKYIEGFENVELLDVSFGVVKTIGGVVDINSPDSPHHRRSDDGIATHQIGHIRNESRKLLYGVSNANRVSSIVEEHQLIGQHIRLILNKPFYKEQSEIVRRALGMHFSKNYQTFFYDNHGKKMESSEVDTALQALNKVVDKKKAITSALLQQSSIYKKYNPGSKKPEITYKDEKVSVESSTTSNSKNVDSSESSCGNKKQNGLSHGKNGCAQRGQSQSKGVDSLTPGSCKA